MMKRREFVAPLAAVSPVDSASAANPRFGVTPTYYYGGDFLFGLP
jgi:hypothetical protein